jgi:cbb3-type cytochrome oxidase subunit 3
MLRDVIGDAGLALYPQVALILFLLVFFSICIYVFMKKKSTWESARYMPLQDAADATMDSDGADKAAVRKERTDGGE